MINITSKKLETIVENNFKIKNWYVGRIVDNNLELKQPVKHAFFNIEKEKNKFDFLLTFDEKILLTLINKK